MYSKTSFIWIDNYPNRFESEKKKKNLFLKSINQTNQLHYVQYCSVL